MNTIQVTLSVYAETPEALARAVESMTRAATGLALEDIDVAMTLETEWTATEDDDEEGAQ